jgi:hypothetical protein
MKKTKCICNHNIFFYPTYEGIGTTGKWKHSEDKSWFADSCRSAGNDCDCETPKPKKVKQNE